MKRLLGGAIVLAGAMAMAVPAFAGATNPQPVQVDSVNMFASGDMLTARGTKGDEAFIGCGTRNTEDGAGGMFKFAFCQANDGEENQVTCFTTNPELVETVREINDFSWITFSWTDDGTGNLTCNRMGFSTQSFYLGKNQKENKVD